MNQIIKREKRTEETEKKKIKRKKCRESESPPTLTRLVPKVGS
jgi:hypothetical protein